MKLEHLFKPINIKGLGVKNRIVRAPMATYLADTDGSVTQHLLDHYEELTKGGAGLIIVEFSYIDKKASQSSFNQLGVYDEALLTGLSELAEVIKAHGAVAGLQICHAGN